MDYSDSEDATEEDEYFDVNDTQALNEMSIEDMVNRSRQDQQLRNTENKRAQAKSKKEIVQKRKDKEYEAYWDKLMKETELRPGDRVGMGAQEVYRAYYSLGKEESLTSKLQSADDDTEVVDGASNGGSSSRATGAIEEEAVRGSKSSRIAAAAVTEWWGDNCNDDDEEEEPFEESSAAGGGKSLKRKRQNLAGKNTSQANKVSAKLQESIAASMDPSARVTDKLRKKSVIVPSSSADTSSSELDLLQEWEVEGSPQTISSDSVIKTGASAVIAAISVVATQVIPH